MSKSLSGDTSQRKTLGVMSNTLVEDQMASCQASRISEEVVATASPHQQQHAGLRADLGVRGLVVVGVVVDDDPVDLRAIELLELGVLERELVVGLLDLREAEDRERLERHGGLERVGLVDLRPAVALGLEL